MLVETTFKQDSFYNLLYQMIPDNHILKRTGSEGTFFFASFCIMRHNYRKNRKCDEIWPGKQGNDVKAGFIILL